MPWTNRLEGVSRTQLATVAVIGALIALTAYLWIDTWRPTSTTSAQGAPGSSEGLVDELASGRPGTIGAPRDPLSLEEIGYAKALADPALPEGASGTAGRTAPELLSVELASTDTGDPSRSVAVSYYDYSSDQVIVVAVDLGAGEVLSTETAEGVQPPPSPAEVAAATELLIDSPEGELLRTEYLVTTGKDLTLDELTMGGGSYVPTEASAVDDACGVNRCLELRLQEPGGKYLSAVDYVVDLSTEQVIVLEHGGHDHDHSTGG